MPPRSLEQTEVKQQRIPPSALRPNVLDPSDCPRVARNAAGSGEGLAAHPIPHGNERSRCPFQRKPVQNSGAIAADAMDAGGLLG
ncbi:hypothetical protein MGN01_08660 [Methylobacterium gnaphalii]|uniref:Uncharacterized protein n=1 Tax=Methylobacterium gnaphalii TaxID=1010610 RepID=A0A512JGE2_9HYPH|nr:hypothetical protein MGN01_08660 [Methylobacterium gnaphalii]GLS48944.1 hypothetical protein GCM10007885_17910 [Methylobacterium gnaphalii]